MREVELSLNGTLREIFSFGESRGAFDRFLPSMCVMAEAQRYRPFGHRLSDELSEIILDYLHFDHRLTTTVQWHYKMLEKPVVTTNNGLFFVLGVTYAGATNFTLQRLSILSCRSSPTPGAGGSNSFGHNKKAHCHVLWQCAFWFDVILGNTA